MKNFEAEHCIYLTIHKLQNNTKLYRLKKWKSEFSFHHFESAKSILSINELSQDPFGETSSSDSKNGFVRVDKKTISGFVQ